MFNTKTKTFFLSFGSFFKEKQSEYTNHLLSWLLWTYNNNLIIKLNLRNKYKLKRQEINE